LSIDVRSVTELIDWIHCLFYSKNYNRFVFSKYFDTSLLYSWSDELQTEEAQTLYSI